MLTPIPVSKMNVVSTSPTTTGTASMCSSYSNGTAETIHKPYGAWGSPRDRPDPATGSGARFGHTPLGSHPPHNRGQSQDFCHAGADADGGRAAMAGCADCFFAHVPMREGAAAGRCGFGRLILLAWLAAGLP